MRKISVLLALALFGVIVVVDRRELQAFGQTDGKSARSSIVTLGERLFRDERFSTTNGDLPASCQNCHLLDEDPQGLRAYTDFFHRSWVSARSQDRRRFELRNSPTILDAGDMPRLHYDGEFGSLEELVKGTISGRPMGWLPGEESRAFDQARAVLLRDDGAGATQTYRVQFKAVFGVNLDAVSRDETIELIATAVAAYSRTLRTRKDSPYDRFVEANSLDRAPVDGETTGQFAERMLARIDSLESGNSVRWSPGFSTAALEGMKIFYRTDRGNCVACHAPPQFTDHKFRNIGVSQLEYDRAHGDGAFADLPIPNTAEARRPSTQFREIPSKERSGEADLGHWNFVDLKKSPQRRSGESDDEFLRRMIATFKTPTLRNLRYSQPYFHDGSLVTLDEVLREMIRLSELARAGRLRSADDELSKIRLTPNDIPRLEAFLDSLSENPKHAYGGRRN